MFFLFRWFDSFLPLHNPIGFGASDFVELTLAAGLVALFLARRKLEQGFRFLAPRTAWCLLLLAVLPVALRLALLAHHPVPTPTIYDEFGHLFVADTLRHFRLANPAHPLSQFFETIFILQQPTFSSIYPIGQGLVLALGRMAFGLPWAGVLLASAAFCSLCYWMLRGWTTPAWSLAGGLLAVIEFGPLNPWMNSYWGGAPGAVAGCLVFGALPRLLKDHRRRDAALLGAGLGLHLLIRPYESVFLFLSVALFFVPAFRRAGEWRWVLRVAPVAAVGVIVALGLTLAQNKSVTGEWTTLPYQLSRQQYGVPAALSFQNIPTPHRDLTPQQQLEYQAQVAFRGQAPETLSSYLLRLAYRVRFYRFFFLPPLLLGLLAFFTLLRRYRYAWVFATLALFALGVNFFPAFQFHYLAGVACLFLLVSVEGVRRIARWNREAVLVILFLCGIHFAFWYGMHAFDDTAASRAVRRYETWGGINHDTPERHAMVNRQLESIAGKALVFVHYSPRHLFQDEWVYNEADIDQARVVWARDLGEPENQKLRDYYRDRSVWLLDPDSFSPQLRPYQPGEVAPDEAPQTPASQPAPGAKKPRIWLEDVK